jgi:hypothetical protein
MCSFKPIPRNCGCIESEFSPSKLADNLIKIYLKNKQKFHLTV